MSARPRIVHVLYRLDTGGMEQMLVTLINRTHTRYRHAVVCLDDFSAFRGRIVAPDVTCLALHKKPGKDMGCYGRLWKALRQLKPELVQTWNIGALDAAPVARIAGVRHVVHAERGRDASDPHGDNRKYQRLRRWMQPFIECNLAVSLDLRDWLVETVGIDAARVVHVANGIDVSRFGQAAGKDRMRVLLDTFAPPGTVLIGSVGRLDPVKDQAGLMTAFKRLCASQPALGNLLRLVIVGKGPQQTALEAQIAQLELSGQVCLLGDRDDVPALLSEFDIFVLSSIAEGMPGAVMEAMAAGLPVVATGVGGVAELVVPGVTGQLVAPARPDLLAAALATYVGDAPLRARHGKAGRERMASQFSLDGMVSAYEHLYDRILGRSGQAASSVTAQHLAGRGDS